MPAEAPRVFISYSHDTEAHRDKVLAFADRLCRDDGIDVSLDQYLPFAVRRLDWELRPANPRG